MDDHIYEALEEYCRRLALRLGLVLTTVTLRNKPPVSGYRIQEAITSRIVAGKGVALTLSEAVDLLEDRERQRTA